MKMKNNMTNHEMMTLILTKKNLKNFDTGSIWGKFIDLHETLKIIYDETPETGLKLKKILDIYEGMESERKEEIKVEDKKIEGIITLF